MFLIVRAQGRLKETTAALNPLPIAPCTISKINYQRLSLEKEDEGIIVTSAHAVLAIPQTHLPLFCVGEHTATEAKTLGHRAALTGSEGAEGLAKAIVRRFPAHNIVHVAGDQAPTEWYKILEDKGFKVRRVLSYTTDYVDDFEAPVLKAIQSGQAKVPVFFSNNGVKHFLKLLKKNNIDPKTMDSIAFSAQIARDCQAFKRVAICQAPDMGALKQTMEAVKHHLERTAAANAANK